MLNQHFSKYAEVLPGATFSIAKDTSTQDIEWANDILKNDIAELKKVEEQLKKAEEKYRNIFDNAVEGIFQTTPDGYFISANPAIADIFGYNSPEELINSINSISSQLYVESEYRKHFIKILRENNTTQHFTTRCYRKDKSIIWVSISARAVRDSKGEILYFEGFLQDVTEQKKTNEALIESEERYRVSIEHSNDGVTITRKNIHEYANIKFMEIFGFYDLNEIIGKPLTAIVHPDDKDRVMRYSDLRYKGLNAPTRYEFKGIKKDGTLVYIEVSVALITYKGEKAVIAFFRDITERKKIEAEREELILELQKALSQVKTLHGLLPICASCKKIKNDKGYWEQIETYISNHSEADFSHGICPECAEKLYPEYFKKK